MDHSFISTESLDDSKEFAVAIFNFLDQFLISISKHLYTTPNTHLNPFLIHVIDIFRRNVKLLDDLPKHLKKLSNDSLVQ